MDDTPTSRFSWNWVAAWTRVFVANLPATLLGSWGAVLQGYGVGLFGGVAMLFLLGAVVCGLRWQVGKSLIVGGSATALTQLFPILQVFAGLFALVVSGVIMGSTTLFGNPPPESGDTWGIVKGNFEICGLVFLTGQPLVVFSILLGVVIRTSQGDKQLWFTHNPAASDE